MNQGTLHIAGIQTPLVWFNAPENRALLEAKIKQVKPGTDLVVLPETFTTGFVMDRHAAEQANTVTLQWMKDLAQEGGFAITGSFFVQEGDFFYNRAHFVTPYGEVFTYDKKHLFTLTSEGDIFHAGQAHTVVQYKGWLLSLQVCYDLRFPVWARRSPHHNYHVLLYMANWPQKRNTAWSTLLPARAIENQAFVVGVNRVGNDGNGIPHSGDSVVIDPFGKTISAANGDSIMYATLTLGEVLEAREHFPFYNDRDSFIFNA